MRKFVMLFVSVSLLGYSMYSVVRAANAQIFGDGATEEHVLSKEMVALSSNDFFVSEKTVSENREIEDENAPILSEESGGLLEETIDRNEVVDTVDNEAANERSVVSSDNLESVNFNGEDNLSSDGISLNESVSCDDAGNSFTEEIDSLSENNIVNDVSEEKKVITKVKIPVSTYIYLDPEDISGKGEIFSDDYKIINYGNQDVIIKIKDVIISQKYGDDLYDLSENTSNDIYSDKVKIDLKMVWENESENIKKKLEVKEGDADEYVIFLKASEYSEDQEFVKLNGGSKGQFYFTGDVDVKSGIEWENSGMVLSFSYEIINQKEAINEFLESTLNENIEVDVNRDKELNEDTEVGHVNRDKELND